MLKKTKFNVKSVKYCLEIKSWWSNDRFSFVYLTYDGSFEIALKCAWNNSNGIGKTIVEFFSAAIEFKVWRYLNCRAAGDSEMTSAASLSALDAFCSPSAAITLALASRAASASAAIALCIWTGNRTSLLYK